MKIFLFLLVAVLIILIFQYFSKSKKADQQTLLSLGLWAESVQRTSDQKNRNNMCLAIVYQALKVLEFKGVYSAKEFSNAYALLGLEFSYNNFVQKILETAPLELTQSDEAHQVEARAFFAHLLELIIKERGKEGLKNIILSSKKPHKDW